MVDMLAAVRRLRLRRATLGVVFAASSMRILYARLFLVRLLVQLDIIKHRDGSAEPRAAVASMIRPVSADVRSTIMFCHVFALLLR